MAMKGQFQQPDIESRQERVRERRHAGERTADAILANRIARLSVWQLELELEELEDRETPGKGVEEDEETPDGAERGGLPGDAWPEGMELADEDGDGSEEDGFRAEEGSGGRVDEEGDADPSGESASVDLVFALVPHPSGQRVLQCWSGLSALLVRAPRERRWAIAVRIRDHLRLGAVLQATNEAALRSPDAPIQPVSARDLITRLSLRKERLSHLVTASTLRTADGRRLPLTHFIERAARTDEQVKYQAVALAFAANEAAEIAGEFTETALTETVNLIREWLDAAPVGAEAVRKARSGLGIRPDRARRKEYGRGTDFVDALRVPADPRERAAWKERWHRALAEPPSRVPAEARRLVRQWTQRIESL